MAERNVVRMRAAVCGEECCMTTLKTAARETRAAEDFRKFRVGICSTNIRPLICYSLWLAWQEMKATRKRTSMRLLLMRPGPERMNGPPSAAAPFPRFIGGPCSRCQASHFEGRWQRSSVLWLWTRRAQIVSLPASAEYSVFAML